MKKKKDADKFKAWLTSAYVAAGRDYLAFRLIRIISKVENDKDRVLHNDMISEIDTLIGAHRKELLTKVADYIILLANKGA